MFTFQNRKALIVTLVIDIEYNKQYVNGYNDGWVDARNGVQDPKC
jgi:hypothetical protein